MFTVLYQFEVKADSHHEFKKAWEDLTNLIYENEGSLGSRLHAKSDTVYLAYAQWPDKETWKNSGDKLPTSANEVRQRMKESCINIETLHELEVVSDLLKSKTF